MTEPGRVRAGDDLGDDLIAVPRGDYQRLLLAAEADGMIVRCEVCGAWLDRDDPACAVLDDFTGCWKAATLDPANDHLCRSYRQQED
jgi:hypothetical protein